MKLDFENAFRPNRRWEVRAIAISVAAFLVVLAAVVVIRLVAPDGVSFLAGSPSDRVVARVGETELRESELERRLAVFRACSGLSDDEAWAAWLANQRETEEDLRARLLEELIDAELARQAAERAGVMVSEEELDAAVAQDRRDYLGSLGSANLQQMDEEAQDLAWANALALNGYDEQAFRELRRTQLTKDAVATALGLGTGDSHPSTTPAFAAWYATFREEMVTLL